MLVHEAEVEVLIPFLAGLLFGRRHAWREGIGLCLNPLFGGSAFRTFFLVIRMWQIGLNPLFGGSAFRTSRQ